MSPKLNTKTCSATPALLLGLLTVCYIGSVTCLSSEQQQDSNSIKLGSNRVSKVTIAADSSLEEAGCIPNTSSDDPNSAAETAVETDRKDVGTTQQSEAETRPRREPFWARKKMIALYVLIAIVVIAATAWFFLVSRGVVRTRLEVKATMRNDPELTSIDKKGRKIDEFLIVFNWTQNLLYLPTIIASLFAAILICVIEPEPTGWFDGTMDSKMVQMIETIGAIWFVILFLNFLVAEYNVRFMVIITGLVSVGFLLLWLYLFGWVQAFFRLFRHLNLFISWTGYLLVALIGLLTIVISWIKGLFYFVAITPNFINVQEGLTETGTQIARKDFYTSVDTTDLVERLFGVGKIVITFKDNERRPMTLLVWRIGTKAKKLEEMGTKTIVT